MKSAWIGSGFSHHNVPSLSNTAMRSSTGTASETVASTKATTTCRAAPSFQLVTTPGRAPSLFVSAKRAVDGARVKRMTEFKLAELLTARERSDVDLWGRTIN